MLLFVPAAFAQTVEKDTDTRLFEAQVDQNITASHRIIESNSKAGTVKVAILRKYGDDFIPDTCLYSGVSFTSKGDMLYTLVGSTRDVKGGSLIKDINANHEKLKALSVRLKGDFRDYSNIYKAYRVNLRVKTLEAYDTRLEELAALNDIQHKYLAFMQKKIRIEERNDTLVASPYKDVTSAYRGRYSKYNLSPSIDADADYRTAMSQLDELFSVQDCYLRMSDYRAQIDEGRLLISQKAGKDYSDVAKNYEALFKTYNLAPAFWSQEDFQAVIPQMEHVLAVQKDFLYYIDLRERLQIGKTNISTACGGDYSELQKAYAALYKSYNMSANFSDDKSFQDKKTYLESLLKVQQRYLDFIAFRRKLDYGKTSIETACSGRFSEVEKSYMSLYKRYDLAPSFTSEEEYLAGEAERKQMLDVQQSYLSYVVYRERLLSGSRSISEICGKEFPDVNKKYQTIYKSYDFDAVFETVQDYELMCPKLEAMLSTQNCFTQFVDYRRRLNAGALEIRNAAGKDYADVAKAYDEVFRAYDLAVAFTDSVGYSKQKMVLDSLLQVQTACLQFIDLRKDIQSRHNGILAATKSKRNTGAAYRRLADSFDLTWKPALQPEESFAQLRKVIALQSNFAERILDSDWENRLKGVKTPDAIISIMEL